MYVEAAQLRQCRRLPEGVDLSDLTSSTFQQTTYVRNEDGDLLGVEFEFDPEPTPEQQQLILRRLQSSSNNEASIKTSALAALDDNRAWVTTTHPQIITGADSIINSSTATATEKQLAQAVKALGNQIADLCQQNNGLIRFALHKFDGTD